MAARVLALLCAVSWLVLPGFGAIDLTVTWSADWPQVLEAGWGLLTTVIVGAAFALVAVRPLRPAPAVAQLVAATAALAISAVFAKEWRLLGLVGLLVVQTVIVVGLLRGARSIRASSWASGPVAVSRPLLIVACAGVVPWLSYAVQMWAFDRESRSDTDITLGIDHYSVQGALALLLGLLPLLAAFRVEVRALFPVSASVAAFYLGLVSLAWPDSPGGLSRTWSAVAIAWALILLAVARAAELIALRRPSPTAHSSASAEFKPSRKEPR